MIANQLRFSDQFEFLLQVTQELLKFHQKATISDVYSGKSEEIFKIVEIEIIMKSNNSKNLPAAFDG